MQTKRCTSPWGDDGRGEELLGLWLSGARGEFGSRCLPSCKIGGSDCFMRVSMGSRVPEAIERVSPDAGQL